ncbi:MAG: hypothetical protein QF681_17970 [Vicinamibacterales bacterium]|jgi:hypothetical protein|nr:hypothetical protein [Vicinamibacterales bacterium]
MADMDSTVTRIDSSGRQLLQPFSGRMSTEQLTRLELVAEDIDAIDIDELTSDRLDRELGIAVRAELAQSGFLAKLDPDDPSGEHVSINASITLSRGSLAWVGVVELVDWMARLAGAVAFLHLVQSAVYRAVDRIVAAALSRFSGRDVQPDDIGTVGSGTAAQPLPPTSASDVSFVAVLIVILVAAAAGIVEAVPSVPVTWLVLALVLGLGLGRAMAKRRRNH